jgi:hypothetical protein
VVGFDSIIPPGRVGKVTQEVNIEGARGGEFKKTVTVESNAANTPSLVLSVKAHIKVLIDILTRYVRLRPGDTAPTPVALKTGKSDLVVSEVIFDPGKKDADTWQATLTVTVTHDLVRSGKPDSMGVYEYTLNLSLPSNAVSLEENETLHGEYRIKTNHPKRRLIAIRGTVSNR